MEEIETNPKKCKSCSKEPADRINVARFIDRLDGFFRTNDLDGAGKFIKIWENEARSCNDLRGLLSVLNEELGFCRRTNDSECGLKAVKEAVGLVEFLKMDKNVSGAIILTNAATTLKAFGHFEESFGYYEKAEEIYLEEGLNESYEYAALLNNKASAYCDAAEKISAEYYGKAEDCLNRAIAVLEKEGNHDGEIALSLVSLAHLYFDRDSSAYVQVEALLDKSWEYINSPRQKRDANYAYILTKIAPSLHYFKREDDAAVLEEVAEEIYRK